MATGTCATNGCAIDMAPPVYVLNNQWGNSGYGSAAITVYDPKHWSCRWDFSPPSDWDVIAYLQSVASPKPK